MRVKMCRKESFQMERTRAFTLKRGGILALFFFLNGRGPLPLFFFPRYTKKTTYEQIFSNLTFMKGRSDGTKNFENEDIDLFLYNFLMLWITFDALPKATISVRSRSVLLP